MSKLKLFEADEKITLNRVSERKKNLEAVANFECETEEHRKARYAVFKNLDRYKRAVKVAEDMIKPPSDKMKEYYRERVKIAKECGGIEDSEGGIKIDTIKQKEAYARKILKLDKDFKEELEKDQKRLDENNSLGDTEIDDLPDPFYAQLEWFPDSVSASKLSGIAWMLKEEEKVEATEEKKK